MHTFHFAERLKLTQHRKAAICYQKFFFELKKKCKGYVIEVVEGQKEQNECMVCVEEHKGAGSSSQKSESCLWAEVQASALTDALGATLPRCHSSAGAQRAVLHQCCGPMVCSCLRPPRLLAAAAGMPEAGKQCCTPLLPAIQPPAESHLGS